jgi:hypothetical protein
MTGSVGLERPALEVADVIRQQGDAFLTKYGSVLTAEQRRALSDLALCRTAALGGHIERCLDCGHERLAYNSCRNRHCPKCQALSRARWLEREAQLLLPVEYHRHKSMTLSAEEFLRRFVQHVLPRGFVKMRHYGLLANAQRAQKLQQCRQLLAVPPKVAAAPGEETAASDAAQIEPAALPRCPNCGGCRLVRLELPEADDADSDTS